MKIKEEDLIEKVKQLLMCDELTSRCFNDGCTDGYDTHFTLLSQEIIKIIKGENNVSITTP